MERVSSLGCYPHICQVSLDGKPILSLFEGKLGVQSLKPLLRV